MVKFSRFSDVEAVMNKANSLLAVIEQEYSKCLQEENIPDSLLVDIKDYLANLRTGLDYLYHKIPNATLYYFPIANSEADFLAKTINLDARYIAVLKNCQNYDPSSWIRCFNLFRNKNSHVTLIPQNRIEIKEFSVKKAGAKEVMATFRGCTFGGNGNHISINGIPMPINLETQFPVDTQGLDIQRKIWINFVFDGSSISPDFPAGISVLPFLNKSLKNVIEIISELEQEL